MKKSFLLLAATTIVLFSGCVIVDKPIEQIPLPTPELTSNLNNYKFRSISIDYPINYQIKEKDEMLIVTGEKGKIIIGGFKPSEGYPESNIKDFPFRSITYNKDPKLEVVIPAALYYNYGDIKTEVELLNILKTVNKLPIVEPLLTNASNIEFQNTLKNKTVQEQAELTLVHYFDLLNNKEYTKASIYNGHGYETLKNWNPGVNPTNYPELIKYGCENNGWQCLKIKQIISKEEITPNEFKFFVQFLNNDNTLFERGPCCGSTEAEMPTENKFEFIVKKIDNIFKVTTNPVYIP